jgi:hypothetical protein
MRKIKLGMLGLVSLFTLSLGLDIGNQKVDSSNNVIMSAEHGRTVV